MNKKLISLFLLLAIITSCTTDPYTGERKVSNTAKGAIIGTAGGAAVGALAGGKKGAAIGAVSGAAVGTGVGVQKNGNQIVLVMPGNITFDTNSAELRSAFKPTLDSVAKVLKKYNKTLVQVVGYTDNTGSAATNNTLSFNRANNVANYLKIKGVSANRLLIEGRGSKNPIASNSTAAGREQNRRVEITLTSNE